MKTHLLIGLFTFSMLATSSGSPATPTFNAVNAGSVVAHQDPGPAAADGKDHDSDSAYLIVPGERFGAIRADSTKVSLTAHFGTDKVKAESVHLAEGEHTPGLVIFPEDAPARVEVTFHNDGEGVVEMIQIAGDGSLWATEEGITLGTPLAVLEQVNGVPFEISGFNWDYGGSVIDWKGGKLEGLHVTLSHDSSALSEEESRSISGDQAIRSNDPVLRKAEPTVSKIQLLFPSAQQP